MFWIVQNFDDFKNVIELYDDVNKTFKRLDMNSDTSLVIHLLITGQLGGVHTNVCYVIPKFVFIDPSNKSRYEVSNVKSVLSNFSEGYFPVNGIQSNIDKSYLDGAVYVLDLKMLLILHVMHLQRCFFRLSETTLYLCDKFGENRIDLMNIPVHYKFNYFKNIKASLRYMNGRWVYVLKISNVQVGFDGFNIFNEMASYFTIIKS